MKSFGKTSKGLDDTDMKPPTFPIPLQACAISHLHLRCTFTRMPNANSALRDKLNLLQASVLDPNPQLLWGTAVGHKYAIPASILAHHEIHLSSHAFEPPANAATNLAQQPPILFEFRRAQFQYVGKYEIGWTRAGNPRDLPAGIATLESLCNIKPVYWPSALVPDPCWWSYIHEYSTVAPENRTLYPHVLLVNALLHPAQRWGERRRAGVVQACLG
ncbi:uncharacterized protein BDV17DRAFT_223338 [Aspergillus undulatus]|uniref:uncharacterized protein n=1 Tax=Aspergillus undulatus TaxID=1810928 RepID=UPI003CCD9A92